MQLGSLGGGLVAAVVVLLALRQPRAALIGVLAVLAAWYAAKVVKAAVDRGRPADVLAIVDTRFEEVLHGQGYPSGHTTVAFALAAVVAGCLIGWWRVAPYAVAAVVGIGRLYFGAHLPLDVVGGAALGVLIGTTLWFGASRLPDALSPTARVSPPPTPPPRPAP
jgi:undecaprenyl-diphosphatase